MARLPAMAQDILEQIRRDPSEYSDVYYFPFFRNYAIALQDSLQSILQKLRPGGRLIVFVRDTARKDILFPTGNFVREVLTSGALREIRAEKSIIRGHIGYLRKGSARGLHGLAQLEWWLAFEKTKRGNK
jgi:hypothetical protein